MIPFRPESDMLLSAAATDFMRSVETRGIDCKGVESFRHALWYFFEFIGRDLNVRELPENSPTEFLRWLATTPIAPRKPVFGKSVAERFDPRVFEAENIARFFRWSQYRAAPRGMRSETTVASYWRYIAPFFESLDPRFWPERVFIAARMNGRRMAAATKEKRRTKAKELQS